MNDTAQAWAAAETAARRSYGRLLAWLAWQWRDIAAAEDALAEAFAAALRHWPHDGVPASPEGWLVTAARRHLLMAARRQRLADDPTLTVLWPDASTAVEPAPAVPDVRLRLLFVCAHPAIDRGVHAALMLQTVLGLDAARIASAFLVSPAALGKRLTRAKAKIRAAGIRFEAPERDELPERLATVMEAVYGAFTLDATVEADTVTVAEAGIEDRDGQLAGEALFLAELLAAQLPQAAEARGLHALLLLCEARRGARRDALRRYVPLDRQDPGAWQHARMVRADQELAAAAALAAPGPYQLEAAIQAAHMQARLEGAPRWPEVTQLYEQLLALSPTVGARIGHAIALAMAGAEPQRGLDCLAAIDAAQVTNHQPWWAAQAHLLALAGQRERARSAYARAAALCGDPAVRAWLDSQREQL